jgi:hypothetical protein
MTDIDVCVRIIPETRVNLLTTTHAEEQEGATWSTGWSGRVINKQTDMNLVARCRSATLPPNLPVKLMIIRCHLHKDFYMLEFFCSPD